MNDNRRVFFPTHHRQDKSRRDGKPYVTIYFDDVNANREAYTHIYSTCRNKKHWEDIIERLNNDIFIVFDNLQWKDEKRGLIDADSIPTVVLEVPKGEIAEVMREHKQQQDLKQKQEREVKPDGHFAKFFTFEDTK